MCIICPKINSRIFEREDERRLHTGAELYETFYGKDYEKEMRAAVDCVLLNKYDPRTFLHQCCNHCRGCYHECVTDLPRYEEMFDIIETRRPLLFDVRIDYFDVSDDMSRHPDIYMHPDFYDWSKEPPCEPDAISLD